MYIAVVGDSAGRGLPGRHARRVRPSEAARHHAVRAERGGVAGRALGAGGAGAAAPGPAPPIQSVALPYLMP